MGNKIMSKDEIAMTMKRTTELFHLMRIYRCDLCTHWRPGAGGIGICCAIDLLGEREGASAYIIGTIEEWADLKTKPDHFCAMWEAQAVGT